MVDFPASYVGLPEGTSSHQQKNTVDGWNLAPPGMYKTLQIMGYTTFTNLNWLGFLNHQQYHNVQAFKPTNQPRHHPRHQPGGCHGRCLGKGEGGTGGKTAGGKKFGEEEIWGEPCGGWNKNNIPRTQMTSIFEGQPPQNKAFFNQQLRWMMIHIIYGCFRK